MSTYVVGDIQGCFEPFLALLQKVRFNPGVEPDLLQQSEERLKASLNITNDIGAHERPQTEQSEQCRELSPWVEPLGGWLCSTKEACRIRRLSF